jgi:formylglycine-generating enzyme required for sulfatase activity
MAGRVYRLPTEAVWEYACRAGAAQAPPFGFGAELRNNQANFGHILMRTCRVASYRSNAWGLHDMHGNVAEWCADWFGRQFYKGSPPKDPTGPPRGQRRVMRGGSWGAPDNRCRSAARNAHPPDTPVPNIGFRVVCDVSAAKP